MKYNRIFWLENDPAVLGRTFNIADKLGISAENILNRTTFAFNVEQAEKKLRKKGYDLFVLDFDVPVSMEEDHEAALADFCKQLNKNTRYVDWNHLWGYNDSSGAGFTKVYRPIISKKKGETVLYTLDKGRSALVAAYQGIPYYHKAVSCSCELLLWLREELTTKQFQEYVLRNYLKDSNYHISTGWEFGGVIDFVRRYLI